MIRQKTLVPAYFYPSWLGSAWDQLIAAAEKVRAAIMNPASGPGSMSNSDYVAVRNRCRDAGCPVIGYVPTSYGNRAEADVKADCDKYKLWYGVDGIFFDEVASGADKLAYYTSLFNYVKAGCNQTVVLNHGTTPDQSYLPICDVDVVYENTYANYLTATFPSWMASQPPEKLCHLVHAAVSAADMVNFCRLAAQRNAAVVYVTSDVLPNPWDTLPGYWADFLAYKA